MVFFKIVRCVAGPIERQQRYTQPTFVITALCLVYTGQTVVLPYLYTEWGHPNMIPAMQWFGYFVAIQILVNWLCVKLVPSKYDPSIHGAEEPNYSERFPSKSAESHVPDTDVEDSRPKRIVTSYFSWSICIRCENPRPPRCHHCPICRMCILKRDHHCFLTNVCIGYRNLRHFIVFLFWTVIGSGFCIFHMTPYYVRHVLPNVPLLFNNPFSGMYTNADAKSDIRWIFLTLLFGSLLFFSCWSMYYFQKVTKLLLAGKTSFEMDMGMNVCDNRSISGKLRSVFGKYWVLNFFIPLHTVYEPEDDPAYWPYMR